MMSAYPQAGQPATPDSCTLALLDLLPSVECLSPKQALQVMETERESENMQSVTVSTVYVEIFAVNEFYSQ